MHQGQKHKNKNQHVDHLEILKNNPNRFSQDKERAIESFASKIRAGKGFGKIEISKKLAEMVWDAQGGLPIYYWNTGSFETCWNDPKYNGWDVDYIKYEICHNIAVNRGGSLSADNLFYGSAQCNRTHGALSITEWVTKGNYKFISEIVDRYNKVLELYSIEEFIKLNNQLNNK
jgi:hypothetical protein